MKPMLLIVFFVCCAINAQNITKKCKFCGKPISQCQYKGKHPSSINNQNKIANSNNVHRKESPSKAIDLGLSSGTKWAEWNLGASSPEEYGAYYAWGETNVKTKYTRFNHKHPQSPSDKDGNIQLSAQNDIATILWGNGWRIPSPEQIYELTNECNWKETLRNRHKGYTVTGPNGNSIFIPYAGYYDGSKRTGLGGYGLYWSSQGGDECCASDDSGWAGVMDLQTKVGASSSSGFCWLGAPIRAIMQNK